MSGESDATTPEAGADPEAGSGAEAGSAAESPAPARWSRILPPWIRRRPRIAALIAGVLVAALIAGVVLVTMPSSPPGPRYASLPKQPCALVGSAEVDRYLPGATGVPDSFSLGNGVNGDACKWSSRSGGADRTLGAQAFIFRSPYAVTEARLSYRSTLSRAECHCTGVAVSARPVPGLGDQAAEVFVAPRPDANFADAPNAANPGTTLLVRSSNALIIIAVDTTATATGAFLASPPSPVQLAGLTSMARDTLSVLARPASVPPPAITPVTPDAHYAGRRDPCKLISAATLARYAPGAVMNPLPAAGSPGSSQTSECDWDSDGASISMTLNLSPGPAGARQDFDADFNSIGSTVTGARTLPDLGGNAVAEFTIAPGADRAELYVRSGNAELDYAYTTKGAGRSRLDPSAPLAGVIAMARDGLAALARPAASSFQQRPHYAGSQDACTLIKPSTLARYGVSGTGERNQGVDQESMCGWGSESESFFADVTIYSDPDTAQGEFQFDVQDAHKTQNNTTFNGARSVSGVGQQAEAIFETMAGNAPAVELYVWSGNATVDISSTDLVGFGTPLSRAGKLAADIAMARDVLAGLHRR